MGILKRLIAVATVLAAAIAPVHAERLVTQLSTNFVEITSSYVGERMTLFGSIEPAEPGGPAPEGPFHVVIVISGPPADRVTRRMTNQFGVWINTEQVVFEDFPSYFQVLSSGRLLDITSATTLAAERILPEGQPQVSTDAGWWRSSVFSRELVRLMTERGLFGLSELGVQFHSETFYSARLALPSDAPPGNYLASTYVFRDGDIVGKQVEGFVVRAVGFERFLVLSARQQPLVYGIACVVLALFTGWLGGVVFRR